MGTDMKPTYDELLDVLGSATRSLRAEAELLQESTMSPDGSYMDEDDRRMVDEAFSEISGYRDILRRAGRKTDDA